MSIDRIGQYAGFYNRYKTFDIPTVSVEAVKEQQTINQQQIENVAISQTEYASETQNLASKTADLENISLSFNKAETYDYIGRDANLENLDMMSAISDMQKDKVLEQYHYFVGPKEFTGSVVTATPDGMVVQK